MTQLEAKPYANTPEFRRDRLAHVVTQRVQVEKDYQSIRMTLDPTVDPLVMIEQEYQDARKLATIGISVLLREIVETGNTDEIVPARETIGFLATYLEVPQKDPKTIFP